MGPIIRDIGSTFLYTLQYHVLKESYAIDNYQLLKLWNMRKSFYF